MASSGWSGITRAGSTSCCATSAKPLLTFLATVATAVLLYVVVPKGFFPQQDTGRPRRGHRCAQDVSFDEMVSLRASPHEVIGEDPAVAGWAAFVGGSQPLNNGFVFLGLKPRDERHASADQVVARLRRKIAVVQAAPCSCRPRRT